MRACKPGLLIGASRTEVASDARAPIEDFARHRAVLCRDLLDPAFLQMLFTVLDAAEFAPDPTHDNGGRLREYPGVAGKALSVALSRPEMLHWAARVTGRGPLLRAAGSVLQMVPHVDALYWHDDLGTDPNRRLGITLNLGRHAFEGGSFELRRKGETALLARHRHDETGAMLVFDVADTLEHRVWPVVGGGPRRVFTGWFLE